MVPDKIRLMEYSYPLLKKVFGSFKNNKKDLDNIYLVCCQHLLEPQLKMFELFIDFGFDPQKIIVLGKAYSTNKDIFKEIERLGIKVLQPDFLGTSFDFEHKNNCKIILGLVPEDAAIIILDDGGELIKTFLDAKRKVFFGVEQTSSGFRKLENENLSFPVINVARSVTKLVQESPLIARLCFERINNYFLDKKIENPSILVVGLGPIGESILEILGQNNFTVNGFDLKNKDEDLLTFLGGKSNVIIGATGSNILSKSDIEQITSNNPLYLISVSSSDREFPVASFRNGNELHNDVSFKNIIFVNNGFPITFKGNRNELAPIEIEKTICLLGGSVCCGVVNEVEKRAGLVDVSEDLERLIN